MYKLQYKIYILNFLIYRKTLNDFIILGINLVVPHDFKCFVTKGKKREKENKMKKGEPNYRKCYLANFLIVQHRIFISYKYYFIF